MKYLLMILKLFLMYLFGIKLMLTLMIGMYACLSGLSYLWIAFILMIIKNIYGFLHMVYILTVFCLFIAILNKDKLTILLKIANVPIDKLNVVEMINDKVKNINLNKYVDLGSINETTEQIDSILKTLFESLQEYILDLPFVKKIIKKTKKFKPQTPKDFQFPMMNPNNLMNLMNPNNLNDLMNPNNLNDLMNPNNLNEMMKEMNGLMKNMPSMMRMMENLPKKK